MNRDQLVAVMTALSIYFPFFDSNRTDTADWLEFEGKTLVHLGRGQGAGNTVPCFQGRKPMNQPRLGRLLAAANVQAGVGVPINQGGDDLFHCLVRAALDEMGCP